MDDENEIIICHVLGLEVGFFHWIGMFVPPKKLCYKLVKGRADTLLCNRLSKLIVHNISSKEPLGKLEKLIAQATKGKSVLCKVLKESIES